ncbi:hypothetical protein L195_g026863, partial [Trifolium pratense]
SSTTTIPPKSPSLTNSTPEFSNSMLSDKDDTKKTHVEDKVVTDSNFETNVEMKNIDPDSSFLTDLNICSNAITLFVGYHKGGFHSNSISKYCILWVAPTYPPSV